MRQVQSSDEFYKENDSDVILWVEDKDEVGVWEFSFDRQTVFNLFEDYPYKLSQEQRQIFQVEQPEWAEFFRGREN